MNQAGIGNSEQLGAGERGNNSRWARSTQSEYTLGQVINVEYVPDSTSYEFYPRLNVLAIAIFLLVIFKVASDIAITTKTESMARYILGQVLLP